MTRTELIIDVAKQTGLPEQTVAKVIKNAVTSITTELARGGSVSFVGFGSFGVRKREARIGRNPLTDEKIKIAAKTVPFFKAGSVLKQTVADGLTKKPASKAAKKK